nr:chloride intracellular channel protein 6-like [Aegilops tauschii subsp. strangulata]
MLLGDGEAVGRAGDGAHGDGVDGATRPGEAGGDEARRRGGAGGGRECLATAERRGRQRAPGAEVVAPIQNGIGESGGSEGSGESGREKWEGEDAENAISKLNGYGYDNLILHVEWATPRPS